MQITKEQYLELKNTSSLSDLEDKALELGLISESDKYGYGIRTIRAYEKDGEYYLEYTTFDSCD